MKLDLYGWMPQENKDTLAKLIKEHNVKTVIEIGCFLGLSTKFFVEQGCNVVSIDTFEGAADINRSEEVQKRLPTLYEQFMFNMQELGIADKVHVVRMTSEEAAKPVRVGKADLIYIDGSHQYEDVKLDIELWKDRATKVLCGDDYTPHQEGVRRAVDELLPEANKDQRVWYVIK
ncbi:TPA: hypothetical protein DEB29_03630 [Candidatus Wolfebacteria bacterium]|nr:hypothetical protein [Candidatus Wolfebacteria bacterium]